MREERTIRALPPVNGLERRVELPPPPAPAPYAGYGAADAGDENHLREYLRAARKHLWLIVGVVVLITMLVALVQARKPDIYTAAARLQVDLESNPAAGATAPNGSSVVINSPTNDPAYFNTQLQILTSPGLLRRVVKTLDLEHNQAFLSPQTARNRSPWQNLLRALGRGDGQKDGDAPPKDSAEVPLTGAVAPATSRDDLVEAKRLAPYVAAVKAGLRVDPVKETRTGSYVRDTRLIDVSFTHADPQLAAKIVNAVADTFALANLEKRTETTATAGDFLQKRVADLQAQIRSGEERLVNYAKNNQIISLDASQNTVVERLAGLNKQLLEAENERKEAEAAYRAAQAPGAASALAEKDAKTVAESESKLAALKEKLAQLLVESTPEWPEVKETQQQIAALEKQVGETRGRAAAVVTTNLETRYRQALAREMALRAAFDRQRGETVAQNQAAISYRIIQQEIETNKGLLDGLLQRSKENDVVMAGTPNNIFVLDYALAPEAPTGPNRLRAVALALFLSLGLGVGLAILLEHLDDSVGSTADVERLLGLPALAAIPAATGRAKRRLIATGDARALEPRAAGAPELLTHADARTPLAEAHRHLRTSILLSTAGGAPRTLLVTSSVPGEGKTTTSVNMAISLAQTGAKVLLVDADMRRPRLQTIFGVEGRRGLSTILSSDLSEAEILGVVVPDAATGLYLLPAGAIPPNPAELLGSAQTQKLVATLAAAFTHVVFDSPPIGSFTDGVILSTRVDGVLLVVQAGKTSRQLARRSRQLLHDVGARVCGVVLNNVSAGADDYYHYQQYYQESYNAPAEEPGRAASGAGG